jgi:hypothetical protein
MDHRKWRDKHSPAAKPAGCYREIADGPGLIIEIELIYAPKVSVGSVDRETL